MAGVTHPSHVRNQRVNASSEQLFARVPEQLDIDGSEQNDPPLAVHLDNGVGSGFQQIAETAFAFAIFFWTMVRRVFCACNAASRPTPRGRGCPSNSASLHPNMATAAGFHRSI